MIGVRSTLNLQALRTQAMGSTQTERETCTRPSRPGRALTILFFGAIATANADAL